MKSSITFRHFWPNHDITKEFIFDLVKRADPGGKKIYITSVFTNPSISERIVYNLKERSSIGNSLETKQKHMYHLLQPVDEGNVVNIWYTGENLRPPLSGNWDALLSFEKSSFDPKNIHLPFWATTLGATVQEAKINQEALLMTRNISELKKRFAVAVIGNPEPTRLRIIEELQKLGVVDLFGSLYKRPIKNKHNVIREYNFNLCFENDLYPGYVTEKVFDAWKAQTIPLWWGLDSEGYLNSKAIVNFAENTFKRTFEILKDLLDDEDGILEMQSAPLLVQPFDYDGLIKRLNTLLLLSNKN
jgi:hypothetical protein